jgi:hypothetical protein
MHGARPSFLCLAVTLELCLSRASLCLLLAAQHQAELKSSITLTSPLACGLLVKSLAAFLVMTWWLHRQAVWHFLRKVPSAEFVLCMMVFHILLSLQRIRHHRVRF